MILQPRRDAFPAKLLDRFLRRAEALGFPFQVLQPPRAEIFGRQILEDLLGRLAIFPPPICWPAVFFLAARLRPRIAPLPAQLDAIAVFGRLSIPRDRMLMLATSGWSSPATQELRLARDYLGRPYDHFFYETRDQIYCSELIYAAFKEGPDIDVGKVERMGDLNIDTPAARKLIQQRWKAHPLCKTKGAKSFEACYELIVQQTVVTPASIARDPKMEHVYSNFGWGAE